MTTASFQAPQFYRNRGYSVGGCIEDDPLPGMQNFILEKPLPESRLP